MSSQQYCFSPKAQEDGVKSCCSTANSCHATDQTSYSKNKHCSISRLSIDIDPSSFRPHVSIPFVWISDIPSVPQLNMIPYRAEDAGENAHLKIPPDIPPREYLSLISVLII